LPLWGAFFHEWEIGSYMRPFVTGGVKGVWLTGTSHPPLLGNNRPKVHNAPRLNYIAGTIKSGEYKKCMEHA